MKFLLVKALCLLCVLCGASVCLSLDREAFSITNYDLNLQIEPDQHRLGARGKITLRNDTSTPRRVAVLQVSSSLDWRSIRVGDKMLQYVTQPYTSDIDHTGSLSEAIITLPQEIAPHSTIDLEIAYEGVIVLDATRLIRIGTPEDAAKNSDWDRIDETFTGLRGAGYVAWYPIATDVANLSEGDNLFEVLSRWKTRQTGSRMTLGIAPMGDGEPLAQIIFNGINCAGATLYESMGVRRSQYISDNCMTQPLRQDVPTLVIGGYRTLERSGIEVRYLENHDELAAEFADNAEKALPVIKEWFGPPRERVKIAELPPDAATFESGVLLLMPLKAKGFNSAGLSAAHQLTHASFLSFRPWIEEGLAHFAQVLYLEQQNGRQAALDYMSLHRSALTKIEPTTTALDPEQEKSRALVSTVSEELYRSKAMCVWWMLRDMIGDAALKKALASYKPEEDNDPTYMPRLIAAQTQRDLSWFFDDWLYRDRGLPDFKVDSAYAARTPTKSFMLTLTLDNLGTAAAEVPVIVKFAGGEITKRVELHAKSKLTFRVETPRAPQEVKVNDGSVPESDLTNNGFKLPETTK
jgi:hypothetical protein